jgi:transcriptional regulator
MYIPKSFEVNDKKKLYHLIKSNSFGILFSLEEDGLTCVFIRPPKHE